ncbi:MAG: hemolysin family protein, partial [Chloroflexi bacterium]|nr:hemolysin family protein [Chloroflexota bacterium]
MIINILLGFMAIVCLVLLMMISITEAGLLSINRVRVKQLVKRGFKKAEIAEKLLSRNYHFSAAIIILNSILTIGFSLSIFVLAIKLYGFTWLPLIVAFIINILIVVLSHINARTIAIHNPEKAGFFFIKNLAIVTDLIDPVVKVLSNISRIILRVFGVKKLNLVQVLERTVRDIMVPRSEIVSVNQHSSILEVLDIIIKQYHNRILVYDEDIDNIVGMVNTKDVLRAVKDGNLDKAVKDIVKSINFIPESHRIDDLLREFQQHRLHVAVVVDEYGGTAGIVTMEDLLEELAGYKVEKLSELEAIMNARMSINDLNEVLDLEIEGNGFDTVGAFVF